MGNSNVLVRNCISLHRGLKGYKIDEFLMHVVGCFPCEIRYSIEKVIGNKHTLVCDTPENERVIRTEGTIEASVLNEDGSCSSVVAEFDFKGDGILGTSIFENYSRMRLNPRYQSKGVSTLIKNLEDAARSYFQEDSKPDSAQK